MYRIQYHVLPLVRGHLMNYLRVLSVWNEWTPQLLD